MMKRLLLFSLIILCFPFHCGCSSSHDPAEITALNLYSTKTDGTVCSLYFDYVNNVSGKTAEYADLIIEGQFTGECADSTKTTIRFSESEGIPAGSHNTDHVRETSIFLENQIYTAYIRKLYFTDGTEWDNTEALGKKEFSLWSSKGQGESPVQLLETNFYRQYEYAVDVEFNADWKNTSANHSVIGVFYQITPKDSEGNILKNSDGSDMALVYPQFFDEPVAPGFDNPEYHLTLKQYNNTLRSACTYDIQIVRTVSETGLVWDTQDTEPLTAVMVGRKDYAFTAETGNRSINKLIQTLQKDFQEYALDEEDPLIYIRDRDYCVLRFANMDVRVELSDQNEVMNECVSFVIFFSKADYDNNSEHDGIVNMIQSIYMSVIPDVLTEFDKETARTAVNEYLNSDADQIVFPNPEYTTLHDGSLAYDESGMYQYMHIAGAGKNFDYDPSVALLWAGGYVY